MFLDFGCPPPLESLPRQDGPQLHLAAGLVAGVVGTSVTAPASMAEDGRKGWGLVSAKN